jgi:glycosyltransferase involved in cell wall biosynthesis
VPEVSVICTVRNGERTIKATIDSILTQSFIDWELVIVDDGSTDSTRSIIRDFAQKDSRIKVITTEGVGRGKALNLAINNSKGRYIANIDADDPSHWDRIKKQLRYFHKYPNLTLLSTGVVFVCDDEDPIWQVEREEASVQLVNNILIYRNPISHSSVMMKREDLLSVGLYNEKLSSQLDYDLWVRFAERGYKLGYISTKLASKRIHSRQSFENKKRIHYLKSSIDIQKKAIKNLNGGYRAIVTMYLRFLYGLMMPQKIRVRLGMNRLP